MISHIYMISMPTDSLPSHKSTSGSLGRGNNVSCISTWTWWYALWSSFALSWSSLALHTTLLEFLRKIFMILMLMLRFCWCYTTHISMQQPQGTKYAALRDMKMLRHMNMLRSMTMLRNMKMLRYMTFLLMLYCVSLRFHTWTYVNSSRCVHCKKNPEEQGESQDPHGWRRWLLEGPQANHPWKFAIEKGPGAQSSNMEMHALFPVAVGVHRENLMEATADALKKMWEKVAVALYEAEVMEGLSFQK